VQLVVGLLHWILTLLQDTFTFARVVFNVVVSEYQMKSGKVHWKEIIFANEAKFG